MRSTRSVPLSISGDGTVRRIAQAQPERHPRSGAARPGRRDRRKPGDLDGRRSEPQPRHRPRAAQRPRLCPARSSPTCSCSSSASPAIVLLLAAGRLGLAPGLRRRRPASAGGPSPPGSALDILAVAGAGDPAGLRHLAAADRHRRRGRRPAAQRARASPRRAADRRHRRGALRRAFALSPRPASRCGLRLRLPPPDASTARKKARRRPFAPARRARRRSRRSSTRTTTTTTRTSDEDEEDEREADRGAVLLGALAHSGLRLWSALRRRAPPRRPSRRAARRAWRPTTTISPSEPWDDGPAPRLDPGNRRRRRLAGSTCPSRTTPPQAAGEAGRRGSRRRRRSRSPASAPRARRRLLPRAERIRAAAARPPRRAEGRPSGRPTVNLAALEQNARLLEGVLEDFGVRGEIINVRPGPVVTLYELEPAPGIKSARVIGLADDIARSMSAIACRVAVIPGKNAIGIELPNARRETVYLRELLASRGFREVQGAARRSASARPSAASR